MIIKIILVTVIISFVTAYSCCSIAGSSDKLVEEMMVKNPQDFGLCNNDCFTCGLTQECRIYIVMREG